MIRALIASVLLLAPAVASAQTPPRVTLDLTDTSVSSMVMTLAFQLHEPFVIDTDAQEAARCARLTLSTGGPQDVARVLSLLSRALRPSGLSIARDHDGLRVSHIRGAPLPHGCATVPDPPSDGAPPVIATGIRVRPDGAYEITVAARDAIFGDLSTVARAVRVIPHEENGRVVGISMYGIRRGSIADLLGFQNGDVLRRVGGRDIATAEAALDAYSHVREADHVDVEITRRGQPLTLHFVVVAR